MNIWYILAAVIYLAACCFVFSVGAKDLVKRCKSESFIIKVPALALCFVIGPILLVWFFVIALINNIIKRIKHRNKNKKVPEKNVAVVFMREYLGLEKHEHFRFTNQKTDDVYFFDDLELHKIERGLLKNSKVSFNYITGKHCKIVKLSGEEFQAYMSQYYKGGDDTNVNR